MTGYAVVFLAGLLLALGLTPAVRRLAIRWGAIDQPGERKIHSQPVPRLGGAAVLAAVTLVVAGALWMMPAARPAISSELGVLRWGILASAALLVCAMGAIDDFNGLPARLKLLIEITAAAAVVAMAGAPSAIDFSPFAFSLELGYAAPVLGILLIVALTNAVNMTDVVDGVAGGLSAIAALALGAMSLASGNVVAPVVLFALAGALAGFLPHNFRTPKIFLGDSGSLGAGFLLGAAALVGLQRDGAWLVVPAVLALAVPLAELALTVLRRTLRALTVERATLPRERFVLRAGWPGWFVPDRRHIPHRLLELGLSKRQAIALLYAVGSALGVLGLAAVHRPEWGPFIGLLIVAAIVYFAPRWLYNELRLLERGALLPILESRLLRRRSLQAAYDGVVVFVTSLMTEAILTGQVAVMAAGSAPWSRAAIAASAALAGFWMAGLYRASYRHAGISEALRATRSVLLGMVLAAAVLRVAGTPPGLGAWMIHLLLVLTGVMGARLSFRMLDHLYLQGRPATRRALIFGAGRGGDLALREIRANPEVELEPAGFVDDDEDKAGTRFHGLPVYASHRVRELARALKIDDLVVSTRKLSRERHLELAEMCSGLGVRLLSFDLRWTEIPGEASETLEAQPELVTMPEKVNGVELVEAPTQPVVRFDVG